MLCMSLCMKMVLPASTPEVLNIHDDWIPVGMTEILVEALRDGSK